MTDKAMANGFLPPGSEPMSSGSEFYFRPEEGENRVRILAPPIIGWIGWTAQRKPLRRAVDPAEPLLPTIDPEEVVIDDKNQIRKFWAMPVWDYRTKRVRVWEIAQSTIQGPIKKLAEDVDWGDPRRYDLSITRETKGDRTTYTISPKPKRRAEEIIVTTWKEVVAAGFDVSRLFSGGDPFRPGQANRPQSARPSGHAEDYLEGVEDENVPVEDEALPF
jgi:hypothetical protein